jgi:starch synthase
VPVVNQTGGLRDTVSPLLLSSGEGLGFTFQSFNREDMLGAIYRALDVYFNDKKLWSRLVKNDMQNDSSWKKPAEKYTELYTSLLTE